MQDPVTVGVGQGGGDGQADGAGVFGGQGGSAAGEGSSPEEFHDDQVEVVGFDIVVDPDHVRMV